MTTKRQREAVREYAAEEMRRREHAATRRTFKLVCLAAHEAFGFGAIRAGRLIETVNRVAHEKEHDPVFWRHVDMVMTQLRLEFDPEDYDEMDD